MDVFAYAINSTFKDEGVTLFLRRLRLISILYLQGEGPTKNLRWDSIRSIFRRLNVRLILNFLRYSEILFCTSGGRN